jgi:hypothetical protein
MNKSLKRKYNSISEKNNDICVICREVPETIGKINTCNHLFCFDCIKKWSNETNLCPLCKSRFNVIKKIKINNNKNAQEESIKIINKDIKQKNNSNNFIRLLLILFTIDELRQ